MSPPKLWGRVRWRSPGHGRRRRPGLDLLDLVAASRLRLVELVVVQILAVQLLVVVFAHARDALVQGQIHRVDGLACHGANKPFQRQTMAHHMTKVATNLLQDRKPTSEQLSTAEKKTCSTVQANSTAGVARRMVQHPARKTMSGRAAQQTKYIEDESKCKLQCPVSTGTPRHMRAYSDTVSRPSSTRAAANPS